MYLDLEFKAKSDMAFRFKLESLVKEYEAAHAKIAQHSKYGQLASEKLLEIFKVCNNNTFYLVGHYFPKFPRNEPLSFHDYPFVSSMLNFQIGGFTVLRGSRQIAKTTGLSIRQIINANIIPGLKSLYITPRSQQLNTYQNKLREAERAFRFFQEDHKLRKNLKFKEFSNKSTIELVHVLSEAGGVRGKSTDELLFDEYQDFDGDLETEVEQCQSASPIPITIYSGTSLTTETALEGKFLKSSQGYYTLRCTCGHFNIPLPEYGVMDMIQPDGPTCTKCKRLLNVYMGHFVHASPKMIDAGQLGFHVPQIIVPAVVKNKTRWAQIYQRKLDGNPKKFLQELLGIPTEEGIREITRKHLEDMCILGDREALQQRARDRQYEYIVSGCDWGGTDPSIEFKIRVSTTVHVMMGIRAGTHDFDIIHMRRYEGMDYESIAADICMNHSALNGFAIATDEGVGSVYNSNIRKILSPERHLQIQYGGPREAYFTEPQTAHTFNTWRLNKTESITELYQAIKKKRIRSYRWDHAQAELLDFLNMFRAPAEMPGGSTTFVYRPSATKPNDTLQACNYAYTLGRFLLGEPLFADQTLKLRLEQTLRGSAQYYAAGSGAQWPGAISR